MKKAILLVTSLLLAPGIGHAACSPGDTEGHWAVYVTGGSAWVRCRLNVNTNGGAGASNCFTVEGQKMQLERARLRVDGKCRVVGFLAPRDTARLNIRYASMTHNNEAFIGVGATSDPKDGGLRVLGIRVR